MSRSSAIKPEPDEMNEPPLDGRTAYIKQESEDLDEEARDESGNLGLNVQVIVTDVKIEYDGQFYSDLKKSKAKTGAERQKAYKARLKASKPKKTAKSAAERQRECRERARITKHITSAELNPSQDRPSAMLGPYPMPRTSPRRANLSDGCTRALGCRNHNEHRPPEGDAIWVEDGIQVKSEESSNGRTHLTQHVPSVKREKLDDETRDENYSLNQKDNLCNSDVKNECQQHSHFNDTPEVTNAEESIHRDHRLAVTENIQHHTDDSSHPSKIIKEILVDEDRFHCNECGKKCTFIRHKNIHPEQRLDHCDKSFSQRRHLGSQRKNHIFVSL